MSWHINEVTDALKRTTGIQSMEEQKSSQPKADGKGSFWISRKAVDELIARATVTQICAYLILARFTDETGQYATCGRTAVRKALGLGDGQAQRILESLGTLMIGQRRLVYTAEEWTNLTGEVIERPTLKSQVRFHLYPFGEDTERVWFANTLVDGYGKFNQPLKRLKRLGDVAARLLLVMYRENQMEQFGGVPPYVTYLGYTSEKQPFSSRGYQLWHATRGATYCYDRYSLPVLRLKKLDNNKDLKETQMRPFWDALAALEAAGFVYEVVTVMDAEPGNEDANVVYELDARSWHGYTPKGEEGLAEGMARLASHWSYPSVATGRFCNKYALILEQGVTPHVVGISRLRFRVANPKNHTVSVAYQRIGMQRKEWQNILQGLLAPYETEVLQEAEDESF